MKSGSMRLLISEPNRSSGTEMVSLGIIPELTQLVERVVWAMPNSRMPFYQKLVPASDRLIYEDLFWPNESRFIWSIYGLLQRMDTLVPQSRIVAGMQKLITDSWLKHLIQKHRITHFFTTWIFDVAVPRIPVPIGAMAMDLNWQHFPENFPERARASLDRSFAHWLAEADVVFPISDFTGKEIESAFPRATKRMTVVPHGAQVHAPASSTDSPPPARSYFYYPASVFAHKGHRDLIEAALALFAQGHDFDLVFSGGRTEYFQSGPSHSNSAIESIRQLLAKNAALIDGRIKSLGMVDWPEVEALFAGARAVILPTHFEGFGLPLLEAIERGVRVICTDIPPFLEQIDRYDYDSYTEIYPAGEIAKLSALMEASLKSTTAARPSPDEITARTQRWTWHDAATAYVEALHAS